MEILLTFAGNRDPFNAEIVKGVRTGRSAAPGHNLDIPEPTDYEVLLLRMSGLCREILEEYRDHFPFSGLRLSLAFHELGLYIHEN